ncbi:MAG: DUF2520 domain-containing protein [Acidobacteriota bacterium]
MAPAPLPSLTLAGPGRAGRALARSWVAGGGRLDQVLARSESAARAAASELGAARSGALGESEFDSAVLVIAVPDDALAPVAELLAGRGRARFAIHLSGARAADEIAALARSGAEIASLHPLRAFRGAPDETIRGAFVAVEGAPSACDAAERFTLAMGADPHRISREAKPLYHAGATLAAGGVVALLSAAVRAWALAGLPQEGAREALSALAAEAVAGAARTPFELALTGPLARRDLGTIGAHRRALEGHPDLLELYALLAAETLARTPGRGNEEEIRALFAC